MTNERDNKCAPPPNLLRRLCSFLRKERQVWPLVSTVGHGIILVLASGATFFAVSLVGAIVSMLVSGQLDVWRAIFTARIAGIVCSLAVAVFLSRWMFSPWRLANEND